MKSLSLMVLCLLVCSVLVTSQQSTVAATTTITEVYIDQYNGTDTSNCLYNGQSCSSINYALGVLNDTKSDVIFYISKGNYTLDNSPLINEFSNLTNVHFIGTQENSVDIYCKDQDAGLAFYSSRNVSFEHMTFTQCGLALDRTISLPNSYHYSTIEYSNYIEYRATLSFQYCQDVTIKSVVISNTNGLALDIWNTNGTVIIVHSSFIDNKVSQDDLRFQPGGGGIAITMYYDFHGNPLKDSHYTINNCTFIGNNATVGYLMYDHHTYNDSSLDILQSNGGGLAILLHGESQSNIFHVLKCYFSGNAAWFGAGLMVQFTDLTNSNEITVESCDFHSNHCFGRFNSPPTCQGGGARVDFIHENASNHKSANSALFHNCIFTDNTASTGGGMSIVFSNVKNSHLYIMNVSNCSFTGNKADNAGSALFISSWANSILQGRFLPTVIIENTFFGNNKVSIPYNATAGMGCVYSDSIPLEFNKRATFTNNQGTALVVSRSEMVATYYTSLLFTNNTGHSGAAIALINKSWLTVHEGTLLHFENNTAHIRGGAIYATQSGYQDRLYSEYCFVRYHNRFVHPSKWKTNFTFINNAISISGKLNAIYALSMLACVWPKTETSKREEDISDTFCWEGWNYDYDDCNSQIETGASFYVINSTLNHYGLENNYIFDIVDNRLLVHPGRQFSLPVTFYNDMSQPKSSLLSAQIIGEDTFVHEYTSNGIITLYGKPNTHAVLVLDSIYPRIIQSKFNVTFLSCPPGFDINNTSPYNECQCSNNYLQTVICDAAKYISYIQWGYFMTYDKDTDSTWVAAWVVGTKLKFLPDQPGFIQLSENLEDLNDKMCKDLGRMGFLCGECLPNKSAPVYDYSYMCVDCQPEQYRINWLYFMLLTFLPTTIFFLIVVIFNISTTSGPANAFIFFAQIIANPITVTRTASQLYAVFADHNESLVPVLSAILFVPYEIWNLDFLQPLIPSFCIAQGMKSMHAYAINYITAFYPLVLIIASYILIEMHARNVKCVMCMWRPFSCCVQRLRRNWDLRSSVIDAFATFLLLSYSKFCLITFYLLVPVYAFDANGKHTSQYYLFFDQSVKYMSGEHVPFFILALLILFLVILPPPVFLFVFPTRGFQSLVMNRLNVRIATSIRMFVEPYQGCYKDGVSGFGTKDKRYFASLYFIFRILAFSSITLSYNIIMQRLFQTILVMGMILSFCILRPYKDDFYNKLDPIIFGALLIAVNIGMYNAAVSNDTLWVNILLIIIVLAPLVYMSIYVTKSLYTILKLCMRSGPIEYRPRLSISVHSRSYDHIVGLTDSVGSLPDRIIHPKDYDFDSQDEKLFTTSEVRLNYGSTNKS